MIIESRCGLKCSECEWREKMKCAGCTQIGNPFWGSCDVKSCCESKNHTHCGQCGEFVCDTLHSFAYAEKEGDNGRRIEQCKQWATI